MVSRTRSCQPHRRIRSIADSPETKRPRGRQFAEVEARPKPGFIGQRKKIAVLMASGNGELAEPLSQRKLTHMAIHSFGEAIRNLRLKRDLSLRELAKKIEISPPFLSDIELGKRYPSEETLEKLAKALKTSVDELRAFDHRDSVSDLKRLIESNPRLGFAFRAAVDQYKEGTLSVDELERRVKGIKKNS
jgi:transcriptional regulator with XRE-family HTH domain